MSNKNPFEIRLEVLEMAKQFLDRQYDDASNMTWEMINRATEYQNKSFDEAKAFYDKIKPTMYTPQDVIDKANELYSFVTKKD